MASGLLGQLTVGIVGDIGGLSGDFNNAVKEVQKFGKDVEKVGKDLSTAGGALTKTVTAPLATIGATSLKAAIDYESAFAGVRKTTEATEEEFAALKQGFLDMSTEIPVAATEIALIGEAAGQLGIEKEHILSFSRTMADLGVSTNMAADVAATEMARFANIMQMPQDEFGRLGSTVVDLGNNFATTEAEIVDMAMRLAGAGHQVGMTESDVMALATALSSVGIESEMGGSALSRVMVDMQVAASSGYTKVKEVLDGTGMSLRDLQMMASHSGKAFGNMAEDLGMTKKELKAILDAGVNLEGFADIAGVTGEQFKKAFEEDAIGALAMFIDGLGSAEEKGESAINMLEEMGISEIRLRDSLLRAGGANEVFANAVEIASNAWKENIALTNEAEERYKTTEAQLQIFWNRIKKIGITVGNALIPALVSMLDVIQPVIDFIEKAAEAFASLDPKVQGFIIAIAGVAAAIGPVLAFIGFMVSNVGALATAIGGLMLKVGGMSGILTALTGPIGLTVAAIAALSLAFMRAYQQSEEFRAVVSVAFKVIAAVINVAMKAVLLVVKTAWTAITQVIDGAIGIISGIIKVFVGLFTLDFSKMWEGIKQIFVGAIDLIIGWMSLSFLGGLRAIFANLLKLGLGSIKGLVTGGIGLFKNLGTNAVGLVKNMATGSQKWFQGLVSSGIKNFGTLRTFGVNIFKALVDAVLNFAKQLVTVTLKRFGEVLSGAKSIFGKLLTFVKGIPKKIIEIFKGFSLKQVGKDIIQGLINGLGSMASLVWDKAKEIAEGIGDTIKKFFGIASPSKLTTLYGSWIGEGLALGIESTVKDNETAVRRMGEVISNATQANVKEVNEIAKTAEQKRAEIQKEYARKRADAEKKSADTIANLQKNAKSKDDTSAKTNTDRIANAQKALSEKLAKLAAEEKRQLEVLTAKRAEAERRSAQAIENIKRTAINKEGKLTQDGARRIENNRKNLTAQLAKIAAQEEQKLAEFARRRADAEKSGAQKVNEARKKSAEAAGKHEKAAAEKVTKNRAELSSKLIKLNEEEQKKLKAINDKAQLDMQKKEAAVHKERLAAIKQYIEDKKSSESMNTAQEAEVWKAAVQEFKAGTKERVEAQKAYQKALKALDKERLDNIKEAVAEEKEYGNLSLVNEAKVWKDAITQFKDGSKERLEAQKEYKNALKAINDEVNRVNTDFAAKEKEINDKYAADVKAANDAYGDELKSRRESLYSFADLFDEFEIKQERTGEDLLNNLRSQNQGFKQWQKEMEKLEFKGISKELYKELESRGVKALPDILALNELNGSQLNEYSRLFGEKFKLASDEAERQTAGLKDRTEKNIEDMTAAANKELEALRGDWVAQIKGLTEATDDGFSSMQDIGKKAANGLLDGLSSMEGALVGTAHSIAESVREAMASALEFDFASGAGKLAKDQMKQLASLGKNAANTPVPVPQAYALNATVPQQKQEIITETHNYEGIFKGAQITIREEADIPKIARMLESYNRQKNRGRGHG